MSNSKETVQEYVKAYNQKTDWEKFIADDIVFDGITDTPMVKGKSDFIVLNEQFLMVMQNCNLNSIISEGNQVAITATYNLALPTSDTLALKTVEKYAVKDGKINHIFLAFDTAKFDAFMAKMPKPQN